jgi:ATP adenylyltransferase
MDQRFEWVTSGRSRGPDAVCDRDLSFDSHAAVTPSLGSIVPGWLLVIPKFRVLSYAQVPEPDRRAILGIVREFENALTGLAPNMFVLEHGPRSAATTMGCGVDQAHLHLIPAPFDLIAGVLADSPGVVWKRANSEHPWAEIPLDLEYYLMSGRRDTFIGYPRKAESQFFRQRIARLSGMSTAWDYRECPHYDNAHRTLEYFGVDADNRRAA